jgi:amidophosphoribosyltransferase
MLSHDLIPGEKGPQDACGVFGVWAPGEEVAKLTYFGLYALQHRGQEAAGIAVSEGTSIVVYKDLGLVSQVFDEATLASLRGHLAIGHCRYSTTGGGSWENAQPAFRTSRSGTGIALGHNGNLVNTVDLALEHARGEAVEDLLGSTTDSDLVTAMLAARIGRPAPAGTQGGQDELFESEHVTAAGEPMTVEDAAMQVLPQLRGAFSFVFMDETTLYAARDPQGVRPLALGRLERGWVVASETAALDIVGASFVREVEPGELLAIDEDGLRSRRFAAPAPKGCLFEYVYLARPDTTISGRTVHAARVEIGRRLAREQPAEADLVMPVPESGTPAAIGYAEESGIPYRLGLVKNAYVGRTFIQPSQTIRQLGIRLKLNPLRDVIRGKRLVVVDDSIVRGNTQRALVRMLREAGAVEVHVRISSPPVKWPCFYGIDFASRAELIANGLDVEGIRASVGADSLGYVSLEGLVASSDQPHSRLCSACFDGHYPIPLSDTVGKNVLERGGAIESLLTRVNP